VKAYLGSDGVSRNWRDHVAHLREAVARLRRLAGVARSPALKEDYLSTAKMLEHAANIFQSIKESEE
jgi:DNA-binding phage protein